MECGETGSDNEERAAEFTKTAVDRAGPEHESIDAIDAKFREETPMVSIDRLFSMY